MQLNLRTLQTREAPLYNTKQLWMIIFKFHLVQVTSQAEELKELKKVIYKSEDQRPSNSSFLQIQPKLTDDQRWKEATGAKEDSQIGMSVVRRRWRDVEESKTFEESGVYEDPIQPTEKKKTLSLRP